MSSTTTTTTTTTTTHHAIAALNVLNLVAYIANVGLVNGVPTLMNLPDNAVVSGKFQTLATPAGWAFAIWGLIFLMQAIWSIVQIALPAFRTNPLVVKGVRHNYIAVCAFQVAWTFAFSLEQITLSLVWMLGILYFLVHIYVAQQKVLAECDATSFHKNYWLLRFPFGLHLGWIVAATLVNFNVVLVALEASTSVKFTTAVATVLIAMVVATGTLYIEYKKENPDVVISLVLVWALNAISKELKDPRELILSTYSTQQIDVIQKGSFVAGMLLLVASLAVAVRAVWKRRIQASRPEEDALLEQ